MIGENVRILDCTLRDGGYYNNWDFDRSLVEDYLLHMARGGVDFVELGFRFTDQSRFYGPYAYTSDEFLETLDLPAGAYDAVLGLGAIHHVERLEQFWDQVRRTLKPGGFVLAQEYVGPSRFQWTEAQIELGNAALRRIVPRAMQIHHDRIEPVDVDALIALDPSETVRSDEILATCEAGGFALERYHGAGCGLLQPVLQGQIEAFDPLDWEHNEVLFRLFAAEDHAIASGRIGDCYAMFVARPASQTSPTPSPSATQ